MSKIKLLSKHIYLVLTILTFYCSSFAADNTSIGTFTHDEIEQRLSALNADVDFRLTPEVKKYLQQYLVSYRQSSETLIGRSLLYFPDIEGKIREKSLPSEIKFLSVVESSLKPAARSHVGATGLWQFMKGTARMYGLKIDKHIDERKDIDKSTDAALTYLSDLNERFGDWTLALAAYNCGPGNVRKAMRRSGGNDYWSIRSFLPRETRNYVPKFIAMAYVMNYYLDHDLAPNYPDALNIETRKILVKNGSTFSKLAKITGVDRETMKYYNPSYLGNYIPKSPEGKIVELPTDAILVLVNETNPIGELVPDQEQEIAEEIEEVALVVEERELIEIKPLKTQALTLEAFQLMYDLQKMELPIMKLMTIHGKAVVETNRQGRKLSKKQQRKISRTQYASKVKAAYTLR